MRPEILRLPRRLLIGGTVVATVVVIAFVVPWLSDLDPNKQSLREAFIAPLEGGFLLGTDSLGRDLGVRILYGARISLVVAGIGMVASLLIGTAVGFASSFTSGLPRTLLLRLIDTQLAFPYVLLAIALTSAVEPSVGILILLMALAGWAPAARVIRSMVLQELGKDYPKAAEVIGASRWRIATKYVLPAVLPIVLVLAPLQMAAMIVMEATLSFLGMGVQPPDPSWGVIMLEGRPYMRNAWWLTTLPGIAITIVAASLLAIGGGIDDAIVARRSHRASPTSDSVERDDQGLIERVPDAAAGTR